MKTQILVKIVPTALAMSLAFMGTAKAAEVTINPNSDPITLNGTSGGGNKSNCGNIAATPNEVIQVKQSLPYLRLTVTGQGRPTLLINGPSGRFCVLADDRRNPEISGYWQAGTYSLHVGNLSAGQHPYNLSISRNKNP